MAAEKKIQHSGSYANNSNKIGSSIVHSLLKIIKNERDRLIVRLFAETGCTSNELVNIKNKDIDFINNSVAIRAENTRGKSERVISISEKLSLALKNFSDKNKVYVFSSNKSPRLRTRSIRKIFCKYSTALGIKITSRELRKSYINDSIREKKPIEEIKKTIGIKRLDKKEFLSQDEFDSIGKLVKNRRDRLILDILFKTGCALDELVNIKVEDIEFTKNSLLIKSTKKQRQISISEKLSLELKGFAVENKLSDEDYLFSTRQSRTISGKRAFQIIKEHSIRAGFEVNPQVLRYSNIANSLAKGKSIRDISNQTGIKNLDKFHLYGALSINKND